MESKDLNYDAMYSKDMTNTPSKADKKKSLYERNIISLSRCCRECKHGVIQSDSVIRCIMLDLIMLPWETCAQFTKRK